MRIDEPMTDISMTANESKIVFAVTPSTKIACSITPMAGIFSAENSAANTPRTMER